MCVGPRDRVVDLVTQIVSEEHLWDRRCVMDLVSCLACHLVDGGYKFPPWCICRLVQIFVDRPFVGPSLPNRPYVLSSPGAWWTVDMNPPIWSGPDGYPRVLDYSTFEFTTLPYSKNFTTRSSSRVVTISSFCPIIQIFGMGRHHSFLDNGRHVSNDVVA